MRFFLFILFIGGALSRQAQFSPGQFQLGLGGGHGQNSSAQSFPSFAPDLNYTEQASRVALVSDVGVFVHRSLVIGVQVGFQRQRFEEATESTTFVNNREHVQTQTFQSKGQAVPFGLYLRAYQPLVPKLLLFADARSTTAGISGTFTQRVTRYPVNSPSVRQTIGRQDDEWRAREFQVAFAPGLLYRIGVELSFPLVTYTRFRYTQEFAADDEFSRTQKDFNFFRQLGAPQFGLRAFL